MFGPPKDVVGECNARLYLGDDYGDNVCTIRCGLPVGHEGPHKEEFQRGGKPVIITWQFDEREEENDVDNQTISGAGDDLGNTAR